VGVLTYLWLLTLPGGAHCPRPNPARLLVPTPVEAPTGAFAFLQTGDMLRTADNRPVVVEGVAESGEVTTVYNFHVADYHTYYVGHESWGFEFGRTTLPGTPMGVVQGLCRTKSTLDERAE